ncbi:MAG: MMPL family transporter [Nanoarchaeota archaeon]|nr:MMPL family transporter [Nanoarchaeota archaeon]
MDLKIFKNWRILLMVFCLILAIIAINPIGHTGVVIKSIDQDSPFYGKVLPGEKINWANEKTISKISDFDEFQNFTGVFRFMHNDKLDLVNIETPGLGIRFVEKTGSNIQLGMDLVGGTRVLLEPTENVTDEIIQQTKIALETRINTYGLAEVIIQPIKDINGKQYIQIEMAGGSRQEIEDLLSKQGKFEGRIPMVVAFESGSGVLKIGGNEYSVIYHNTTIELNNQYLSYNETFKLNNIDFKLENFTSKGAVFISTVFRGDDITSVCMQNNPGICTSTLTQQSTGWQFMFQIFLTEKSAEKFAAITQNMKSLVDPNSGESYLESRIYLYLDNNEITNLGIAADLAGKALTQPVITGGSKLKEDALNEKLKLQSILKSGALPVGVKIIRADDISPSLGKEFADSTIKTSIIALLAVAIVIFLRYKKFKILIPMMIWSVAELILTLGVASSIHWTLDMASIAGLIAAIGTGTNDQIMIIDEIMLGQKEKIYTLKQKVKKSFGIIFSAAATIIAAMLPLFFVGIGVMKGFAITTTIGILIGVFITRTAFATVMEYVLEKELNKPDKPIENKTVVPK